MVYAIRGVGKTFFSLNVAYAVASGGTYLKWNAPKPRGVLYLDGEMPAVTMQERLASIVAHADRVATSPLRILTPDRQEFGTPNLADPKDVLRLEELLEGIDLIIVDNVSTLIRSGGRENDEDSWRAAQDWLLQQRGAGRSVLVVHHAGKGGQQRGTSKREDVLDTIIKLKHPPQYEPEQGAKFEVHFDKSRGFYGEDARGLCAEINEKTGTWAYQDLSESTFDLVVSLAKEGLNMTEIASELDVNKSTVSRHLAKARKQGLISQQN